MNLIDYLESNFDILLEGELKFINNLKKNLQVGQVCDKELIEKIIDNEFTSKELKEKRTTNLIKIFCEQANIV